MRSQIVHQASTYDKGGGRRVQRHSRKLGYEILDILQVGNSIYRGAPLIEGVFEWKRTPRWLLVTRSSFIVMIHGEWWTWTWTDILNRANLPQLKRMDAMGVTRARNAFDTEPVLALSCQAYPWVHRKWFRMTG